MAQQFNRIVFTAVKMNNLVTYFRLNWSHQHDN